MAAAHLHPSHLFALGLTRQLHRAFFACGNLRRIRLNVVDLDFAIQAFSDVKKELGL